MTTKLCHIDRPSRRYYLTILLLVLCISLYGQNQGKSIQAEFTNVVQIEILSPHYKAAYLEISDMLNGKKPLSFKRAVFLQEWAYLGGNLDYDSFCKEISEIAVNLKGIIKAKGIGQFKTAGNYAIFEFYTVPSEINNNKPLVYDFEDCGGEKDLTSVFVTKLLRTHKGQCRSLPMLYKILADEIGAEAHIAFAPMHSFIRHHGEDGKWVNVDLTNHKFPFLTDGYYIDTFGISTDAIRNNVYLYALDDKESVAWVMSELYYGYNRLFEEDEFTLLLSNESLKFYPQNPIALANKINSIHTIGNNLKLNYGAEQLDYHVYLQNEMMDARKKYESLGETMISTEIYDMFINHTEEKRQQQQK